MSESMVQSLTSPNPWRVHTIGPDHPKVGDAVDLEAKVFHHAGYLASPADHYPMYAPYHSSSDFVYVCGTSNGGELGVSEASGHDDDADVIAVTRVVQHSAAGFPVVHDLGLSLDGADVLERIGRYERSFPPPSGVVEDRFRNLNPATVVEIATAAIDPTFRGVSPIIGGMLYRDAYRLSVERQVTHWIAGINPAVLDSYKHQFRFLFRQIGEPGVLTGSPSVPVIMDLREGVAHLGEHNSYLYEVIVGGFDLNLI